MGLVDLLFNLIGLALVTVALSYLAVGLAAALLELTTGGLAAWRRFSRIKVWQLGVAVFLVALVLGGPFLPMVNLIVVVTATGLLLFIQAWLREARFLMGLGDGDFPGRQDKLIWIILLIVVAPAGIWLFRSYHQARWPVAEVADRAEAAVGEAV